MKKVMVLLAAFMLLGSSGVFATSGIKRSVTTSNKLSKKVKNKRPATKHIFVYVSSCGAYTQTVYWCFSCSSFDLWLAENNAVHNAELACVTVETV